MVAHFPIWPGIETTSAPIRTAVVSVLSVHPSAPTTIRKEQSDESVAFFTASVMLRRVAGRRVSSLWAGIMMEIDLGWGDAVEAHPDEGLIIAASSGKRNVIPKIPTTLRMVTTSTDMMIKKMLPVVLVSTLELVG